MLNLTTGAVAQTMTSTEIAELTGKRHDNVMEDIRKMFEELNLNAPDFSGTQKYGNNNIREIYNLPKRECLVLVSGYSVKMRAVIIDKWQLLESQKDEGMDDMLYIAQMAMRIHETRKRTALLEAENAILKGQVKIVEAKADAVLSQSGFYSVLGFCKLHELPVTLAQAAGHSRGVNKLCQRDGIERQQTVDPRFGKIYIYPELQLFEYFSNKGLLEI